MPFRQWMSQAMADLNVAVLPITFLPITVLSITVEYAALRATLPNPHRDPFDRPILKPEEGDLNSSDMM
jgi:PIN domain nuclease of toxin-antitoxin system